MKSELLSQEGNIVTIKAEIEAERFDQAIRETLRELAQKANIKGFRKGRIPRRILELYMGKDAIRGEALELVVPPALRELISEYGIDPIAEPQVKLEEVVEGQPLEFTVVFEVRPEVTLADASAIQVDVPRIALDEAMVDETVKEIRKKHVQYEVVNGPAAEGHAVQVSYTTAVIGDDEAGQKEPEEALLDLSSPGLRSEIREGLLGKAAGDEALIDIVLDAEHPEEKFAGKTIRYTFVVKEVKLPLLPEVDTEFIKNVTGDDKVETVEAFREMIADRLKEQMGRERDDMARSTAVVKLVELSSVDVPEKLVNQEFEALLRQEEEDLKKQQGASLEEHLARQGLDRETYESQLKERASRIVKQTLVLDSFAEEQGITVESEDIDNEISAMAHSFNVDEKQLKGFLVKDMDRLNEIVHRVRVRKTVDHLLSQVSVNEIDVPAASEEKNEAEE